jgi:hypothetical protein
MPEEDTLESKHPDRHLHLAIRELDIIIEPQTYSVDTCVLV